MFCFVLCCGAKTGFEFLMNNRILSVDYSSDTLINFAPPEDGVFLSLCFVGLRLGSASVSPLEKN